MANIVLSQGIRQNLLSLQDTSSMQQKTQLKLATGKRVNSALDSPVNFFTSSNLQGRAGQLGNLLDSISNGVKTIEAADKGLTAITKLVDSAKSTIKQALADALSSRPTIAGTGTTLATAAEVTATGKTLQQIAQDKLLEGAVTAASSGVPGNLNVTANSVVTINLQNGTGPAQTYSFTTNATMTVRDFVNQINASGLANASVDANGLLNVVGTGSGTLKVSVGNTAGVPAGADNTKLGLTAANWSTGATATPNSSYRTTLIQQYNEIRNQIDKLASDASFNGINLLNGDQLSIIMNEKTGTAQNTLKIQGYALTSTSLGILTGATTTAAGQVNFQNDTELGQADQSLTDAVKTLQSMASNLGANLSMVQIRQDFTKQLIDTLKSGADNLVMADQNEEGANLLALNTRQQLSQTALSLSSQAEQGVLRLFQ